MSIVQSIRDKGAWIIFAIIVLAMLAFIFQDSSFRGNLGGRPSNIGSVNGESIKADEFSERLEEIMQQQQQQGGSRDQMVGQLWNYYVGKTLLRQQCDKLGITVTAKEISDFIVNTPPQWLTQQFTDQNGRYDQEKALQAFAQMKKNTKGKDADKFYNIYIEPIEFQLLNEKYNAFLAQAAYTPKWLSDKMIADNSMTASAQYVYVPYTSVTDSTIKVTDEDVRAYEKKHASEFEQEEETRNIAYVSFSVQPSKEDSAQVFSEVQKLGTELATATDVEKFLTRSGTATPYYNGFISKKEIKQPYIDTIVKAGVGNTYGPYIDGSNYNVAKVVAVTTIPDTVKVRHILIGFKDQQGNFLRDDSAAKKLADSLKTVIAGGANFDSLCVKFSTDGGSKDKGGVYENIAANAQMVPEFNDFIFTNPTGHKGVVRTQFGYHYIEVLSQKGSAPGYKIAYVSKPIKASQSTLDAAQSAADAFAANNSNFKDFEANARKQNLPVMVANDVLQNDVNINGLGAKRDIVRWIYNNKVGNVSEPFDLQDKFIVAALTAVNEKGLWSVSKARPQVEYFVRNEKIAQRLLTKFKGTTLDEYAKSTNTQVANADAVQYRDGNISGVGNEPKVVGVMFNKTLTNKVSQPIAGNSGVFAVKPGAITAQANTTDTPESIKQQVENAFKQATYRSTEALRKAAKITDNRADFY